MKNISTSRVSPKIVTEAVLDYLVRQNSSGAQLPRLEEPPHIICRPWSTLYFLTVLNSDKSQKLVVKIVRFQDQKTAELSWQSKNLLARGRSEFDTMTRVFNHFANQSNPFLCVLSPIAYLPDINAVVMNFSDGKRINDFITPRYLLTAGGRRRTKLMMRHAGQWLRCFHNMLLDDAPVKNSFGSSDIFQALLDQVDNLCVFGVDLKGPLWDQTLTTIEQINHNEQVWSHGDFCTGNLLVFPDQCVLGLDVVMDRIDSPYYDLGRFVGDLKTRRSSILRFGLLPPPGIINSLRDAFLTGYFDSEQYAKLPLALYEGYFIFREWVDNLIWARDTYSESKALLDMAISKMIINPTFYRIVTRWMQTVNDAQ